MAIATAAASKLPINVGPLNGLGSFCLYTARALKEFSDLYMEGEHPEVEWDLRHVEPTHMSMAGLTAFLATAHRLRQFTGNAQLARVIWNPEVFAFWDDISLFQISQQYDLLKWPEGIIGGYSPGQTNPNTELLAVPYVNVPDRDVDLEYWKAWKDSVRQKFKDDLLLRCGRLFHQNHRRSEFPQELRDNIAVACAELVVNSLLWGRSTAFVGLQRSGKGITVAVCDSGVGFITSMQEQSKLRSLRSKDHAEALAIGAVINRREYGLRRVINTVIKNGGWVIMSSFDAEIHWKDSFWEKAKMGAGRVEDTSLNRNGLMNAMGSPLRGKPTFDDRENGYCRVWDYGLRGTRITFEIPLSAGGRF